MDWSWISKGGMALHTLLPCSLGLQRGGENNFVLAWCVVRPLCGPHNFVRARSPKRGYRACGPNQYQPYDPQIMLSPCMA